MSDKSCPGAPEARPAGALSRRDIFRRAAVVIGGAAFLTASVEEAEALMPQKAAGYQTTPKNGQKCSTCVQFKPPHSCNLVAGDISPDGWCRFYAKKQG